MSLFTPLNNIIINNNHKFIYIIYTVILLALVAKGLFALFCLVESETNLFTLDGQTPQSPHSTG